MITTANTKYITNNVGSNNFQNSSVKSITTVPSKTVTMTTKNDNSPESNNKRLESLTDEEIIQRNLKELIDKKNREERKANGRLVAVILATLVIFLSVYHVWIQKPGKLGSVLVPVIIMLSFGGWVVVLAKRDKARRQMFEKYLEEVAEKNKQELAAKSKSKAKKSDDKKSSNETLLHYENEIDNDPMSEICGDKDNKRTTSSILKNNDHRKHRKHRNATNSDGYSTTSSTSSKKSTHYATKDLRVKRPSIRQKLFRQTGATVNVTQSLVKAVTKTTMPQHSQPLIGDVPEQIPSTLTVKKRKRLQRLNALQVPKMVRIGSTP